ncbi:hypothetical protein GGX14DRAFT_568467 [Mycena pura]|uniref:Uncharacterized protein n=1 Tax=Mycena pura TaxID=153505 RepID=A0AAD6V8F8_9AGAR|nr:hypothetical protein GGX14DRAFT_568467 [Mycena pura]
MAPTTRARTCAPEDTAPSAPRSRYAPSTLVPPTTRARSRQAASAAPPPTQRAAKARTKRSATHSNQKSKHTAPPAAKDQDTDAEADTDTETDSNDAKTDTEQENNHSAKRMLFVDFEKGRMWKEELSSRPTGPARLSPDDDDDDRLTTSPLTSRHSSPAPPWERDDQSGDSDSDKDPDYAEERLRALRKEFDAKGTANELITEGEQEDFDMDDYNDTAISLPERRRRTKGKGKASTNSKPRVAPTPTRAESPPDDDNDSIVVGADALAGGRPSQEIVDRAKDFVKDMWVQLDDLAREAGVSKTTMAKLSGVMASTSREVNLYDAYLWHRRKLNPPPKGTKAGREWLKTTTAEYHEEFRVLPEDERNDPIARRRLFQDMLEEFRAAHFDRMDDEKERGGAPAVMQKTLKYFVNQSTVVAHTRDIHVFGVGIDLMTDTAAAWGGSELFDAMKERHFQPFTRLVNELKSLMHITALDERTEGEDETDHPPINPYRVAMPQPGEKGRDARRRRVSGFLLNLIHKLIVAFVAPS